jgi:hypothetical protein
VEEADEQEEVEKQEEAEAGKVGGEASRARKWKGENFGEEKREKIYYKIPNTYSTLNFTQTRSYPKTFVISLHVVSIGRGKLMTSVTTDTTHDPSPCREDVS